jgi:type IV pilus assembly protein PilC
MPVFGSVVKLIVVERFAAQMSILIDSGVPILYALEITEKLVENRTCGLVVNDIRESVREGRLLADPMEKSGFFPPMAVQMIKVGEETGELSKMLKHVSKFYQSNVEAFMKRFGTMIEPFMLLFMGGVIGTIVLAMFLPMFSMGG